MIILQKRIDDLKDYRIICTMATKDMKEPINISAGLFAEIIISSLESKERVVHQTSGNFDKKGNPKLFTVEIK